MDNPFNTEKIEAAIGYVFKDKAILELAFTHSSYKNEFGGDCNETLEFLGDSILNFIVTGELYNIRTKNGKIGNQGDLTKIRKGIVSREPLATAVDKMGLFAHLKKGKGAKDSEFSEKARSDLFEAVIAAMYLDSGDLTACQNFVRANLNFDVDTSRDYKSALQEYTQDAPYRATPTYKTTDLPNEDGTFFTEVFAGDEKIGEGFSTTKKNSQQNAAKNALESLVKPE